MTILGPDGQPVSSAKVKPEAKPEPEFKVTRQLRRSYLRQCAIAKINQLHGPELRRIRRSMAFQLAKRAAFIEQVRNASQAW